MNVDELLNVRPVGPPSETRDYCFPERVFIGLRWMRLMGCLTWDQEAVGAKAGPKCGYAPSNFGTSEVPNARVAIRGVAYRAVKGLRMGMAVGA